MTKRITVSSSKKYGVPKGYKAVYSHHTKKGAVFVVRKVRKKRRR